MTMTDPIADLLTRIRNAHIAKHDRLDSPSSRLKLEVCRILKEQGFITDFDQISDDSAKRQIRVVLRYTPDGAPAIQHLQRVSRPGRRVYRGAGDLRPVLNGLGVGIVSTSRGLMTDQEARDERVGGEILCEVW
jgi:small subunit ribosomal protein S8